MTSLFQLMNQYKFHFRWIIFRNEFFDVKSFCLYPYGRPGESSSVTANVNTPTRTATSTPTVPRIEELYHNRAVVCYTDRTVRDLAKHRIAPVGISKRDGRMVKALGRDLWIGSTDDGPAAMESLKIVL